MGVPRLRFKCKGCGKPLTDAFSITVGLGQKCRMNRKMQEHNDLSIDLFHHAPRSDYSFTIEDHIVCVIDKDSGRTVTNDAEAVVEHILRDLGETFPGTIIYRDEQGIWDQIVVRAYKFAGFRAISTRDKETAKALVAKMHSTAAIVR